MINYWSLHRAGQEAKKLLRTRSRGLPQSLWHLGWWDERSLVPRKCTPPRVHAPAAQLCTLWKPPPTRAQSGHWSNWQWVCRPGWAAPCGPTPCGLWRSSHSSWRTEEMLCYGLKQETEGSFRKSPYPVATSHIFMVLSLEAETMWSPFGMMATDETLWSCPGKKKKKKKSHDFSDNHPSQSKTKQGKI